jgi:hypothetical protein
MPPEGIPDAIHPSSFGRTFSRKPCLGNDMEPMIRPPADSPRAILDPRSRRNRVWPRRLHSRRQRLMLRIAAARIGGIADTAFRRLPRPSPRRAICTMRTRLHRIHHDVRPHSGKHVYILRRGGRGCDNRPAEATNREAPAPAKGPCSCCGHDEQTTCVGAFRHQSGESVATDEPHDLAV